MGSMMRNAYTAVIARGDWWEGALQTEPYEAAWAGEAVFFVHVMQTGDGANQDSASAVARVQISPDGLHWVDEGASMRIPARADALAFVRVREFGGWLRLSVNVPGGSRMQVVATLALKA
jgi:predicted lipoprotein